MSLTCGTARREGQRGYSPGTAIRSPLLASMRLPQVFSVATLLKMRYRCPSHDGPRQAGRQLGYAVESGRKSADRISRPVLFGPNGQATVSYKIDAFHEKDGIVVEVEAGRAAYNNAIHYDIIRASLILDAEHLVLVVPIMYRIIVNKKPVSKSAYNDGVDQLSALYASQRLTLPFQGVLVVGY